MKGWNLLLKHYCPFEIEWWCSLCRRRWASWRCYFHKKRGESAKNAFYKNSFLGKRKVSSKCRIFLLRYKTKIRKWCISVFNLTWTCFFWIQQWTYQISCNLLHFRFFLLKGVFLLVVVFRKRKYLTRVCGRIKLCIHPSRNKWISKRE